MKNRRGHIGVNHSANAVPTAKSEVRTLRQTRADLPLRAQISGDDVRKIRETNGVSQAVLARHLGTSTAAVTQWEQGLRAPSGATATLLDLIRRKGLKVLL